MEQKQTMQEALSSAAEVISYAARIETAIDNGVAGLAPLIEARLESECAYRRLQCASAIGMEAGGVETARKVAAGAAGALAEASLRLGGFRAARSDHGPALCATYDRLTGELPRHEAQIRADFAEEWTAAAATFAAVRARRAGIEKLLNAKMDLTEPVVAAVPAGELSDMGIPSEKLAELRQRISRIDIMKRAANSVVDNQVYLLHGQSLAGYDPANIYVIVAEKGFDGFPFLAKVVDATFDRGRTEFAVVFGHAKPVEAMIEPSVEQASRKVREIEKGERDAKEAREQRENLEDAGFFEQKSRRYDLEKLAERCYIPTTPEETSATIAAAAAERELVRSAFAAEEAYAERARLRAEKQAAERAKVRESEPAKVPAKKEWPDALH